MSDLNDNDDAVCYLIEGPAWDDAVFWAHWLLLRRKQIGFCRMRRKMILNFMTPFSRSRCMADLRIMAKVFLSQFDKNFYPLRLRSRRKIWTRLLSWLKWGFSNSPVIVIK